ncbi:hypothetical protein WJX73_009115 [Symbiochloris irregularis]|uniref:UAS domain-containing protein n=1 Tax=Symbiochloris irregularis TaxID=706552 RepID=A0AAW1PED7_9CHLO
MRTLSSALLTVIVAAACESEASRFEELSPAFRGYIPESASMAALLLHQRVPSLRREPAYPRATGARRRPLLACAQQASATQAQPGPKIVGFGMCCMDYLAQIANYPAPDAKLRTERLETSSGGNAGNQITASAKLGAASMLFTKIGDDGIGEQMLAELNEAGVNTEFVLREPGHPSPFTYIIIDRQGGTRTCIHTPGAPLHEGELSKDFVARLLEGAALISFDGRLTQDAIEVAAAAREQGVKVLVEAERVRPHLEGLLPLADYIITSAHFPQDWTGEESLADALQAMLPLLPHAQWLITTLGSRGSVLLAHQASPGADSDSQVVDASLSEVVDDLLAQANSRSEKTGDEPACTSANGVDVGDAHVPCQRDPYRTPLELEMPSLEPCSPAAGPPSRAFSFGSTLKRSSGVLHSRHEVQNVEAAQVETHAEQLTVAVSSSAAQRQRSFANLTAGPPASYVKTSQKTVASHGHSSAQEHSNQGPVSSSNNYSQALVLYRPTVPPPPVPRPSPSASFLGGLFPAPEHLLVASKATLQDALKAAFDAKRLLMVHIVDDNLPSYQMNSTCWSDSTLSHYIKKVFTFHQVNTGTKDGLQIMKSFQIDTIPSVLVLNAYNGELVEIFEGAMTGAEFMHLLDTHGVPASPTPQWSVQQQASKGASAAVSGAGATSAWSKAEVAGGTFNHKPVMEQQPEPAVSSQSQHSGHDVGPFAPAPTLPGAHQYLPRLPAAGGQGSHGALAYGYTWNRTKNRWQLQVHSATQSPASLYKDEAAAAEAAWDAYVALLDPRLPPPQKPELQNI